MPIMAIRTISFENVRLDLKVIRPAMNDAKLKGKYFFVTSQICGFLPPKRHF